MMQAMRALKVLFTRNGEPITSGKITLVPRRGRSGGPYALDRIESGLKGYIGRHKRPPCLNELARHMKIMPSGLWTQLQTLDDLGRVRVERMYNGKGRCVRSEYIPL